MTHVEQAHVTSGGMAFQTRGVTGPLFHPNHTKCELNSQLNSTLFMKYFKQPQMVQSAAHK